MNDAIDPRRKNRNILMRHPPLEERELDVLEKTGLGEAILRDPVLAGNYRLYEWGNITWNEMLIMMVTELYQQKEEICKKLEELYIKNPPVLFVEEL